MMTTDAPMMLIDGAAHGAETRFAVINPATEEEIGFAPDASRADLDRAVAAARAAFDGWRQTPIAQRQAVLAAMGAALAENVEELAQLLTGEQGRPIAIARQEIQGSAYWLSAIATQAPAIEVLEDSADRRVEVHHVPLGVVGAIAPWNFPIMLALWKVAPALLTGNCVVLKPSPFTPLTTLRIGELVRDIVPAGVFNIVTGGDQLGPWMTEHPGIDKISFTGSSATGRKVMSSASATLKRITLELGGNDAAIVLADADVDAVVPQLFWASFANSGQICIAVKRLYIHEAIYDRVRDGLVAMARDVKLGNGLDESVQLGPIQNAQQYQRVQSLIDDCRNTGLTLLTGNDGKSDGPGYFVPVTLIDNPPDQSRIVAEEPFGPVLPLLKFSSIDDVVARANDSPYGLAASIWSGNIDVARGIADRLECGTVWINEVQYMNPFVPFGGHKQSGAGVENGTLGMLHYTNPKTVTIRKAS